MSSVSGKKTSPIISIFGDLRFNLARFDGQRRRDWRKSSFLVFNFVVRWWICLSKGCVPSGPSLGDVDNKFPAISSTLSSLSPPPHHLRSRQICFLLFVNDQEMARRWARVGVNDKRIACEQNWIYFMSLRLVSARCRRSRRKSTIMIKLLCRLISEIFRSGNEGRKNILNYMEKLPSGGDRAKEGK